MAQSKPAARTQADRARAMRVRLIEATVKALDAHGFAATSISVVQQGAGVSRGALMHHFSTRNDLIVATAEHLLAAALRPMQGTRVPQGDVGTLIRHYWARIVDTREGRAFVEILLACRTDPELQAALGPMFKDWDAEITRAAERLFIAQSGDPEDVALLWSIARTFARGLVIHGQFTDDPAHIDRLISRFSDLMSGALALKP